MTKQDDEPGCPCGCKRVIETGTAVVRRTIENRLENGRLVGFVESEEVGPLEAVTSICAKCGAKLD
jgi:hypothetical protein